MPENIFSPRMRKLSIVISLLLFVAAAYAINYVYLSVVSDFKYRLVLTFTEGGRSFTKSGVGRVIFRRQLCFIPGMPCVSPSIQGEAIPVDLSDGSQVFILLGAVGPYSPQPHAFTGFVLGQYLWERGGSRSDYQIHPKPGIALQLPRKDFPGIIFFSDPNDPRTATWVNPDNIITAAPPLSETRRRVISATAEVTTEPVTSGLQKKLPWISRIKREDLVNKAGDLSTRKVDPEFLWYLRQS